MARRTIQRRGWIEVFETPDGPVVGPDGATTPTVEDQLPAPHWEATPIGPALDAAPTTLHSGRRGPRRTTIPQFANDTFPNRWILTDPARAQVFHLHDTPRPDPRLLRSTAVGDYGHFVWDKPQPNRLASALASIVAFVA